MSTIVIMPGGFHPFHAGHADLYQQAKKAFPGADIYVAATNDQSERPFPFALKEKLAKLAGVESGHFVQVKSPFQAKEITQHYNPEQDVLIFVRSEKDRNEPPKPGGTKKDGSPAYFQPYTGKDLQPFSQHAYIDYLKTVEFGPGITSATQIRNAWPTLNDKRKTALVMSLYPAAQKNLKLAKNIVGMFDQVMGGQQGVAEGSKENNDVKLTYSQSTPNHLYIDATIDGSEAGGAAFKKIDGVWTGDMVYVQPYCRRQGVATKMYDYAEELVGKINPSKTLKPKGKKFWSSRDTQGVAEGSEEKDNLIWTLNSFGYYSDNSSVYVNDDGDKIVRVGSEWKHQSGKRGRGPEELGNFLSSNQGVAENDLDRFKKYTRPVVKTTPKIEKTTNPAGRTTDHIEWKVTTPTGEIYRYKSKKQAQEHFDSFGQQGVAEGLSEARNSLFAFVKQQFPTWPDYVLKDFLYQQAKGIRDQAELDDFLKRNKQDFGNCKWTLTKLPITFDIFTPKTQRMLASREGGSSNPFQVPRDAERHAQQSQMIQQKGVSAEPIIVAKLANGYDLIEGWHRTIQHLKAFPQGYTGPAWVCTGATYKSESVEQGVAEARTNPEQNRRSGSGKYDLINYAEDNINDKDNWAVSMTAEPKLGINPRAAVSEDTPKGIYFYPLRYFMKMADRDESLPWGDNMPYIQLFQYDRSNEMTKETKVDTDRLYNALREYCSEEVIQQASEEDEYDGTPYWFIYDCLSRLGKGDETNVIRWNKVLRDLGFTSVYDDGGGWIAYNEPTQGVVLDPRIIKQHKMFDNRNPTLQNRRYDIQGLADAIGWSSYFQRESQLQRIYNHPDEKKVMLDVAKSMLKPFLGKSSEEADEMGYDKAIKAAADKVIEILKQKDVAETYIPESIDYLEEK